MTHFLLSKPASALALAVGKSVALLIVTLLVVGTGAADEAVPPRPKRLLLLAQKPDGHPATTHEYAAGMRLLANTLQADAGVKTIVASADEPWAEGPELLEGADGAVLFLSEGAKWASATPERLAALRGLARRGGGLAALHWGMGTKDAAPVADFVALFGGCHGGPDRKYRVLTARVSPAAPKHPILRGLTPFEVEEEFYYALKFPGEQGRVGLDDARVTPLLRVPIDGVDHTVAWAWNRPGGGRSFGFTGGHFHRNMERVEYRRLIAQGVLWTLDRPIPESGLRIEEPKAD